MTSVWGLDVSTFAGPGGAVDCDPLGAVLSTERAVLEVCARRLMSPAGSVPGCPDMGYDLIGKIGARMTLTARERMRYDIEAELEKDERVRSARVADFAAVAGATGVYRIRIAVQLATGTFSLVLKVSQVTIEILSMSKAA